MGTIASFLDVDGVLLDSVNDSVQIIQETERALSVPIPSAYKVKALMG